MLVLNFPKALETFFTGVKFLLSFIVAFIVAVSQQANLLRGVAWGWSLHQCAPYGGSSSKLCSSAANMALYSAVLRFLELP
jgi:hypothetical protein